MIYYEKRKKYKKSFQDLKTFSRLKFNFCLFTHLLYEIHVVLYTF